MADKKSEKMKTTSFNTANLIETYRQTVKTYYERHLYQSAQFWADKLVCLSNDPQDVYWHAQCLFHLKQYHRAAHVITSRDIHKTVPLCHYIAARSLLEAKEFKEALRILEADDCASSIFPSNVSQSILQSTLAEPKGPCDLQSAMMLLKAKVLQANGNRGRAADCYRSALHLDVRCHEAFEALVQHQMLSAAEEHELLDSLPISQQCSEEEASVLRSLYQDQLKKYAEPVKVSEDCLHSPANQGAATDGPSHELTQSLDCKAWHAERLYYNCDYHQCLELTTQILNKDPYHHGCLPVHIGCLVQFRKDNDLFQLSHKLVRLCPEVAISWYAVGCYYFVIGKSDPARRFLNKATMLDQLFGPAWLAYGHSFAAENEHDQAMAAYFRASQLMRGCHLPLLYVGLECGLTNNIRLAEKFFGQAQNIAPSDPYVMHEMGVIAFQNEDWVEAKRHFVAAFQRVKSVDSRRLEESWEPLLNNLGHVSRKLNELPEALQYHQQALALKPLTGSTYAAIGFVHMLMGDMTEAVDAFHEALGLRHDDTFSTTMLSHAMEGLISSSADDSEHPFEGVPTELPSFQNEFSGATPSATGTPSVPIVTPSGVQSTDSSQLSIECEMQDDFTP